MNADAIPGYQDAIVQWDTSEPTDALVQFGESAFLGRTANTSDLGVTHAVQLPGLIPDRTYFYRIVSRDAAGNATVDDNLGQLHRFTTLSPLLPPLIDMDDLANKWSVVNGDETQHSWQLGIPNNGHVSSTPSGSPAWASHLVR